MNITLRYFAQFRERLGVADETLSLDDSSPVTVATVVQCLAQRPGAWATLFSQSETPLLCAINHEMARFSSTVDDGDEVAFFPPVTGG